MDKDGDQRRGKQTPGRPGPAEQGSAERSRKDSPVRRESKGTRSVIRGKGEGEGGAKEEKRAPQESGGKLSVGCSRQAPVATQVLPA